jgi:putative membrane protein
MTQPEPARPAALENNVNSLALDRTVLANERTYAAWLRTGLTALATGLGTARFMPAAIPLWSVRMIAALLLLFGAASFVLAAWRYETLHVGIRHLDVNTIPPPVVTALSVILVCCTLLALAALWTLGR